MTYLRATPRYLLVLLAILGLLSLIACSPIVGTDSRGEKLGTQWGEGLQSAVTTVSLKRIKEEPLALNRLLYSAAPPRGEIIRELITANGRIGIRVLKDNGDTWPIYRTSSDTQLTGKNGERYSLEYRNYSKTKTYEIVATVDGLDVVKGQPGSFDNRGYVLEPGKTLRIDGFRKSEAEVAAFRFARVDDSYAANSADGSPSNVGVIGTAVFELFDPMRKKAQTSEAKCSRSPCAFPASGSHREGYASPPIYSN